MKILICVEHGVAARYLLDVCLELQKRHELFIVQNEDDFADYWFKKNGLPCNNANLTDQYDVYITSGTDKRNTRFDPKYIKAKRKIFMCEPPANLEVYDAYDTVLVASEYAFKRLSRRSSQKVRVVGYPPFERAYNSAIQGRNDVLVLTDWLYELEPSQFILRQVIKDTIDRETILVKPHPYQRWRKDLVEEESKYIQKLGLRQVCQNTVDPFDLYSNAKSLYCVMSIAGMKATLMGIPTYLFRSPIPEESWGFKLHIRDLDKTDYNRKILLSHYKVNNVVDDIIKEIER